MVALIGEIEHYHKTKCSGKRERHADPSSQSLQLGAAGATIPCAVTMAWGHEVVEYLRHIADDVSLIMKEEESSGDGSATAASESAGKSQKADDRYITALNALSAQHLFSDQFVPKAIKAVRALNRKRRQELLAKQRQQQEASTVVVA